MERYETYKDSGIEWIGEIPEGWSISKCKNLFEIKKRIVGYDGPSVLSITQHGIVEKDTTSGEGQLASSYSNYQWVKPGDFAMNHMDLLTGWVDCSELEGVTSPDYRVFVPRRDIDRSYYRYIFQHCYSAKVFYGYGQGVSNYGRWRLPADEFMNFLLPIPPLQEQKQISDYLDKKTAQIDSLIEQTEKSIKLLEEYRKAVISEAVTKGLDPNVPMKDSGIEWIGEIPYDWEIIRLRYLISAYKAGPFGSSLITSQLLPQGSLLIYTPEHVARKTTNIDSNLYLPDDRKEEMAAFFVEDGDIIFPIVGSLGRAFYIDHEQPGIINQRLAKFKIDERKLDRGYFMYQFADSDVHAPYIERNQRGSFIVNLTKSLISDLPFVVPPIRIQKQIAEGLNKQLSKIDALITVKERAYKLLRNYRKSLISEAVTGKFKVPGVE